MSRLRLDPESSVDQVKPTRTPPIQSVSRALAILTLVAMSPEGLTVKEISEALKINRPTLYHLLRTLSYDAYLTRSSDHRYRLGMRIGTLIEAFQRQLTPDETLQAHVRRLADLTDEAAYLVARQGIEIVLLTAAKAKHAVSVALPPPGVLAHAHARASGKVALAFAPPSVQEEYLRTHTLSKLTPNTITHSPAIKREWVQVRRQGFAINLEELAPGLCAIAAPLDNGASPFVISMSAPRDRFDANQGSYLGAVLTVSREASTKAREVPGSRL